MKAIELLQRIATVRRYDPNAARNWKRSTITLNVPVELLQEIDEFLEKGGLDCGLDRPTIKELWPGEQLCPNSHKNNPVGNMEDFLGDLEATVNKLEKEVSRLKKQSARLRGRIDELEAPKQSITSTKPNTWELYDDDIPF